MFIWSPSTVSITCSVPGSKSTVTMKEKMSFIPWDSVANTKTGSSVSKILSSWRKLVLFSPAVWIHRSSIMWAFGSVTCAKTTDTVSDCVSNWEYGFDFVLSCSSREDEYLVGIVYGGTWYPLCAMTTLLNIYSHQVCETTMLFHENTILVIIFELQHCSIHKYTLMFHTAPGDFLFGFSWRFKCLHEATQTKHLPNPFCINNLHSETLISEITLCQSLYPDDWTVIVIII